MKVIDGTMMSEAEGSEDDKKEIKTLIDKSTPCSDSQFCLTKYNLIVTMIINMWLCEWRKCLLFGE